MLNVWIKGSAQRASVRKPKLIKSHGNEANMREMAERMESPEGLEVYRMRAKTVERVFGRVK